MLHTFWCRISIALLAAAVVATSLQAQAGNSDSEAIRQFQRAADAYAFQHRQVQRRLGDAAATTAMAAAMRAARPSPVDGALFTPVISAALRARINAATQAGCAPPKPGQDSAVPRPNDDAASALAVAGCITAVLPRLPEELEYRAAGIALVLVDTHANLVVDILHAAFPPPPEWVPYDN